MQGAGILVPSTLAHGESAFPSVPPGLDAPGGAQSPHSCSWVLRTPSPDSPPAACGHMESRPKQSSSRGTSAHSPLRPHGAASCGLTSGARPILGAHSAWTGMAFFWTQPRPRFSCGSERTPGPVTHHVQQSIRTDIYGGCGSHTAAINSHNNLIASFQMQNCCTAKPADLPKSPARWKPWSV